MVNSSKEMFLEAFQNGLKVRHFNELLSYNIVNSMEHIIVLAQCYVNGEERNLEKRAIDAKERNNKLFQSMKNQLPN